MNNIETNEKYLQREVDTLQNCFHMTSHLLIDRIEALARCNQYQIRELSSREEDIFNLKQEVQALKVEIHKECTAKNIALEQLALTHRALELASHEALKSCSASVDWIKEAHIS
jgi:hypothetical protein